ncbi:MAG: SRPBCC family protein [Pseudomonadota bacterium]
MASVYREFVVAKSAQRAWDALADFSAVHERLVPGFVTECVAEGRARVVTFFNGMVAREQLVSCEPELRRICYASVGGRASHHNASVQVFSDGAERARIVWITDVLPDELATPIASMMDRGIEVMQLTLR